MHLVLCFLFSNEQSGDMTFATPFGTSKFCNVRKQKEANVLPSGTEHLEWNKSTVVEECMRSGREQWCTLGRDGKYRNMTGSC